MTAAARLNVSESTWELIWGHVHRVLVLNAGVALTNLPLLVALAVTATPWRYPVFFGVLAVGLGPSLAASFACLHDESPSIRGFFRGYRRHFRASVALWVPALALLGILATDIVLLHAAGFAAALVPLHAVTILMVTVAVVAALALLPLRPDLTVLRRIGLTGHLMARRWWLSLLNLVLIVAGLTAVNQAPLLGLAVVPGCVLTVLYANIRAASATVLRSPA